MTASFIESAIRTLDIEINAVSALKDRIDASFSDACDIMLQCKGRIVVTGMGKSGHVGNKIAATLASTGTPAFFVHPGEASHGDLGMITSNDVVLALSNSGTTSEVLTIVPLIKRMGASLISMTGNPDSTLAKAAEVHLDISVEREACPHDLAPTASTTVTLALGDALAVSLLEARGFTPEDFAFSHPGGALGRKLLLKISDIMAKGAEIPRVDMDAIVQDALFEMSAKGLGMTTVLSPEGVLEGVFTDGDLRRCLDMGYDLRETPITEIMTKNPKSITGDILAVEALNQMEESSITSIVVVNTDKHPIGIVHLHQILKAGVA
ncbi:Arabinose 5-phosphate isomerase KdsD [BD1-7 clade bacterium]|uniref:Arabinose 5-phosphate isomerase n=1 Tax=BD1-7 clade bacterium TaxID=2029982 RepID=A0A5S9N4W9_9GAMM|nr:Arabinose 5-phosphate isomerase KdsD [BD1-7 clade bacterium]CAA0084873.1 Arabinose 5-phosphate isomerase KdsD [BD1-7 clade bacterium]